MLFEVQCAATVRDVSTLSASTGRCPRLHAFQECLFTQEAEQHPQYTRTLRIAHGIEDLLNRRFIGARHLDRVRRAQCIKIKSPREVLADECRMHVPQWFDAVEEENLADEGGECLCVREAV